MNNLFLVLLVASNVYVFFNIINKKSLVEKVVYILLFVVHFTAFFLFYELSIEVKTDSYLFYHKAKTLNLTTTTKYLGSHFMILLSYPFVKLGISYLNVSLLGATISFIAFIKYFEFLFKFYLKNKSSVLLIVLLLFLTPSLHFWTAGWTKESIVFCLMGLLVLDIIKKNKITLLVVFSSIIILLIRPYLFAIIFGAFSLNLFLEKKALIMKYKLYFFSIIGIGVIIVSAILIRFLKLDEVNLDYIQKNYNKIIEYSATNGNSSIDLKNSNYFQRVFLVMFRPLFYDAKTTFQVLVSVENLMYLFLVIKVTFDFIRKKVHYASFRMREFLLAIVLLLILFYGIYMYNLGLASRMRTMYLPYLLMFIFFINYYSHKKNEKIS